MADLVFISGGARSGKSRWAMALGDEYGPRRRFVATATASDAEMSDRIEKHLRERGSNWSTLQAGSEVVAAVDDSHDFDVVLIDCLTLFLSTLLLDCAKTTDGGHAFDGTLDAATIHRMHATCEHATSELLLAIGRCPAPLIIVSNEVGLGLVPEYAVGRVFRDVVGRANQQLAARAGTVYLTALGFALRLKPTPLTSQPIPIPPPSA